jgi:hypothetical protein
VWVVGVSIVSDFFLPFCGIGLNCGETPKNKKKLIEKEKRSEF